MTKVRAQFDLVQTNGAGQRQTNTAQSGPRILVWSENLTRDVYTCVCTRVWLLSFDRYRAALANPNHKLAK